MPSIYQPRRPRASPLWQIIHHGWDAFLALYEKFHRKTLGPLDPAAVATVQSFLRCGDLASGFTRLQCPDCGQERLLAFTCKGRHFCPACHQRRTRTIGDWIATGVCHEVPHRQFVFTIPKVLRGIFRTRLNLPQGKLAAIAGVHTFGDYLIFHPHLHALRDAKLISPKKLADLLSWKHSGFHIDNGGEKPVPAHDTAGRRRLAEYLLRHPSSLQKITWNATTKTVIYRSKRHHNTKRNFEIFTAPDFIAAILRFRKGSFEWQAIGKPTDAMDALRSLGEEGLLMQENYRNFDRMFYAYILRSEQNPERLYYGFSSDLKKRLKVHNQGGNVSTKTGVPWTLAWYAGFKFESAAVDFERYLKTASRKAFARKRLLRT